MTVPPKASVPSWRERLAAAYLTLDARSLGLGRIVLASMLLLDLARRVPVMSLWYSNDGLLPNHTILWQPPYDHTLSFFFAASYTYEAAVGFGLCATAYVMLLLGWRTRLAQIGSLLAIICLHGRVLFLQSGGDVVLSELALWTAFLPVGRRFSLDARATARAGEAGQQPDPERVRSLACLAVLLQLAAIYLLNAIQKSGTPWKDGSVVHLVLQLDGNVTHLGVWLRPYMTWAVSRVLTHITLFVEWAAPLLILFPLAVPACRTLVIVLLVGLHLGFAVLLNLGLFSFAMVAFLPNLLPSAVWEVAPRFRAVRWSVSHGRALVAAGAEVARSVAPGLLAAPVTPPAPTSLPAALAPPGSSSVVPRRAVLRGWAREVTVAGLLLIAATQVCVENPVIPAALRGVQPRFAHVVVNYLQLFQGWMMFAPEPLRGDRTIVVDAVTEDGRHVDPFNEAVRPGTPPFTDAIPVRLDYDSFENCYTDRIADAASYHQALSEWILRYPRRTGRARDTVISFVVTLLESESVPPGRQGQMNPHATVLFRHPEPPPPP